MASMQPSKRPHDSAEKENRPPKKARRQVSVSTLFDNKRHRASADRARDVLRPGPVGITKASSSLGRSSRREYEHPLYHRFLGAANEYKRGVSANTHSKLDPVYNALIARVDGLSIKGQSMEIPGTSSAAELEALLRQERELSKPLDEEKMTLQIQRADGTTHSTKDVKLGDTMRAFERLVDRKRSEFESLLEELNEIDSQIDATKEELKGVEGGEMQDAKAALDAELDVLIENVEAAQQQTQAEIKKAREEDRKDTDATRRRVEEFMKTL